MSSKVLLISIDGWGLSSNTKGNAVYHAKTPTMDELAFCSDRFCSLGASELDVGLPEGVMGNSEVGHLTMGAGRQLYTDLVKINLAIKDGSLGKNEQLLKAFNLAKERNANFHFLGLLSDGGVHSHIDHLFELIRLAKENKVANCYVHAFMDGRDTPPDSGHKYIRSLIEYTEKINYGKLSTIIGRFFAMDRDKRWERIEKAYDLLVDGIGENVGSDADSIVSYLKNNYSKNQFDEITEPICVLPAGEGKISENDVLLFIDYRSDRMRQIVETFGIKPPFDPKTKLNNLSVFQMTEYNKSFGLPILFPPDYTKNVLAEWLSTNGRTQSHIAETEKYAHVTFFFNGRSEKPYPNEERKLIPSPKVLTYNLKPEMAMAEVASEVQKAMEDGKDFVMCNFAAPDMVGHTGDYEATIKAVEECDKCIGNCVKTAKECGYAVLITSDHGNAEEMLDETGSPKTSHNCNRVPLALVLPSARRVELAGTPSSSLRDVAPTVCDLMGLPVPPEMTGSSLLRKM